MLVISHRGNLEGPNPNNENNPKWIDHCLSKYSMNVEVDVWARSDGLWLGHDEPQYKISSDWLHMRCNFLWIHCKNIEALCFLQNFPWEDDMNFFWHQEDSYTLTSKGFVWAYPGKDVVLPCRAITVMPEVSDISLKNFYGVCTDYPFEFN